MVLGGGAVYYEQTPLQVRRALLLLQNPFSTDLHVGRNRAEKLTDLYRGPEMLTFEEPPCQVRRALLLLQNPFSTDLQVDL